MFPAGRLSGGLVSPVEHRPPAPPERLPPNDIVERFNNKKTAHMLDGYIICATPRTGSTLLRDLLASTRAAGGPDSFFMREIDHHGIAKAQRRRLFALARVLSRVA